MGKINSRTGGSIVKWNQWKALHNAIKDHDDEGQSRNKKADVWKMIDKLFEFMEKKMWSGSELKILTSILESWKKAFHAGWGDQNITHYSMLLNYIRITSLIH